MHDYRAQKADTFETFRQVGKGTRLPKTAVVVYLFVAEEIETKWAAVEKALQAKGFKTSNDGTVLEARVGPIAIDPEAIWFWEERATEIVLPFEFYPDGWELDE